MNGALLGHAARSLAIGIANDVGGMALLLLRAVRCLVRARGRVDAHACGAALRAYGEGSLLVVSVTAAFVGAIMLVQAAPYVRQYGATSLAGWYTGFSTLREVGPVLIALVFSGRVGAANAAELASMRLTEQFDALRALALRPDELLVVPRWVAMVTAMVCLVTLGDLVALAAGACCARVLLDIEPSFFVHSMLERLGPADFLAGIEKAAAFGLVIAVVSTHFGMTAAGGARSVGKAVRAQVVASAVGVFVVDFLMTAFIL